MADANANGKKFSIVQMNAEMNVTSGSATWDVSTYVHFWLIEVSWILYACIGHWHIREMTRWFCVGVALLEEVGEWIINKQQQHSLTWFIVYMLGRYKLLPIRTWRGALQRGLIILWALLTALGVFYPVASPLAAILMGTMVVNGLISHLELACKIKQRKAPFVRSVLTLALWASVWGILGVLHQTGLLETEPLVVWFMTYAALFPANPRQGRAQPTEDLGAPRPRRNP